MGKFIAKNGGDAEWKKKKQKIENKKRIGDVNAQQKKLGIWNVATSTWWYDAYIYTAFMSSFNRYHKLTPNKRTHINLMRKKDTHRKSARKKGERGKGGQRGGARKALMRKVWYWKWNKKREPGRKREPERENAFEWKWGEPLAKTNLAIVDV